MGAWVDLSLLLKDPAGNLCDDDFAGIDGQHSSEPPSARTLTVLKDPTTSSSGVQRPVTCVNWMHDGGSSVVLSYSILAFQEQPAGAGIVTSKQQHRNNACLIAAGSSEAQLGHTC